MNVSMINHRAHRAKDCAKNVAEYHRCTQTIVYFSLDVFTQSGAGISRRLARVYTAPECAPICGFRHPDKSANGVSTIEARCKTPGCCNGAGCVATPGCTVVTGHEDRVRACLRPLHRRALYAGAQTYSRPEINRQTEHRGLLFRGKLPAKYLRNSVSMRLPEDTTVRGRIDAVHRRERGNRARIAKISTETRHAGETY